MSGGAGVYQDLTTWTLFLLSAVLFTVSAMHSGDLPRLIGALLFLAACMVCLLPSSGRAAAIASPDHP